MQIHLISIGNHMPKWVELGYQEYAKRMPRECRLNLKEIPAGKRGKNADLVRLTNEEGERMLAAIPRGCHIVTLDLGGKKWDTPDLSQALSRWQMNGQDIALLVGGPEGLSPACRQAANESWALSPLTFPHPLVRVIVAEQLYRGWSLLNNHPYHR
ncbi:MAG: 23S rRNA (pseudouridine(1915)-N(3))-methyltransferase RlmH [Gammaproteobacteria bacterium]|nr:MAG: 23S rRNA (pseudouridine(1915)-N(3))-methyltransferase RlmH [Gammaproteobacteria bacterium]RLA22857.1 MAG: 23S rRNA (pseudouridine(1915)-N(3))-methyltransferase RlmH [Gammaproteobacteria bacterium]